MVGTPLLAHAGVTFPVGEKPDDSTEAVMAIPKFNDLPLSVSLKWADMYEKILDRLFPPTPTSVFPPPSGGKVPVQYIGTAQIHTHDTSVQIPPGKAYVIKDQTSWLSASIDDWNSVTYAATPSGGPISVQFNSSGGFSFVPPSTLEEHQEALEKALGVLLNPTIAASQLGATFLAIALEVTAHLGYSSDAMMVNEMLDELVVAGELIYAGGVYRFA